MRLYYSKAVELKYSKGSRHLVYHIFEECPYGQRVLQAGLAVFVDKEYGSLLRSDFCRTCFRRHNLPKVSAPVGSQKRINFLRRVLSQSLQTPGVTGRLHKPKLGESYWMLVLSYQFQQLILKWREEEQIQFISWNEVLLNPPERYHSVTDAVKRAVNVLTGEETLHSLR